MQLKKKSSWCREHRTQHQNRDKRVICSCRTSTLHAHSSCHEAEAAAGRQLTCSEKKIQPLKYSLFNGFGAEDKINLHLKPHEEPGCDVYSPLPFSPKARAGGTVIFRFSPGHMSIMPTSRPLMTCPTPRTNHWGCPALSERLKPEAASFTSLGSDSDPGEGWTSSLHHGWPRC